MLEFPKLSQDAPTYLPPPNTDWLRPPPISEEWLLHPGSYPPWVWWGVGVLALSVASVLYRVLRQPACLRPPPPPLANHVQAMTMLEFLRPTATTMPSAELAARVTEVMRTYLHRQFGVLARFRTTQEILAQRRDPRTPPPIPALRAFEEFFQTADTLNYGPATTAPASFIDEAIDTIRRSQNSLGAA